MQSATALTAPPAPAPPARRNIWILNSWRDLFLYVGTPLLLLPLFGLAQTRWSAQDIYIFVGAFGATGHHFPGMIRAYGDRALFQRFKWRFIFAPIFLATVCAAFYFWDLKAIILVLFFWGVWHGMMQTYGFCRIYDAKTGTFAKLNRHLDFAMCALWFAAGVFLSSERVGETLGVFYASGGPFIPPWLLDAGQQTLLGLAILVTIFFILNFVRMWSSNARPNPVKVALLASSIGFWWYCNNGVTNILAGIALFEVFHDVQYLSLVWVYNRNRVEKDRSIGGFMRFVFRRSGSLVGLYIGLVFAYGSFAYLNSQLQIDQVKRFLTGLVAASGLLHFYYDGFIWKVRESSTRASLGLNAGTADVSPTGIFPGWLLHGLKWAAGFVVPVGLLCLWQLHSALPQVERWARVVSDVPKSATHRMNYALALQEAGRNPEALEQFRIVAAAEPANADAHFQIGQILQDDRKFDPALAEYEKAIELQPKKSEFHFRYGETLQRIGRSKEGAAQIAMAAHLANKIAGPHLAYADLLLANGQLDEAKSEYLTALRAKPELGGAYAKLGDIYLRQGQTSQAIVQYEQALRVEPGNAAAAESLRRAKEGDRFTRNLR
jgi:tetratricopeptide (TPR) repeat protein